MVERVTSHKLPEVAEYLEMEYAATVRHEYVAGMIYAMVGASKRHNRIVGKIYRRLADAAEGGSCRVYMETVKLRAAENIIYYPDVMVACGPEGDDPLIEESPWLVVEVTSPSTESIDRREKMLVYREIPGLKAYLIVHQKRCWVERHWRDETGEWRQGGLADEGRVPIPRPETELALAEIYEGL